MAGIVGRTGNTNSSTSPRVSGNKRTKFCSSFGNPDSSTSSNLFAARAFGSSETGICLGNTSFAVRPFERDAGTGTYLSQEQAAALSNFSQAQDAAISNFNVVKRFERNTGTEIFAGSFFGAETGINFQSQTQPTVSSITPAIVGASSATSIESTHLVSSITQPTVSSITQANVSSVTPAIVGASSGPSSSFGSTHLVAASAPAFGSNSSFGQTPFEQYAQQNMIVTVPQQVSNPFGTLPPMPEMFIGQSGRSIQHEISSMLVNEKPAQVRTTNLLNTRRTALRPRSPVHSRRYNPKKNGRRVSFFSDGEEAPCNLKADATLFIPRENPRTLFIQQFEQSSPSVVFKPAVNLKELAVPINDHGMMGQDRNGKQSFENDAIAQELQNAKENWPGDVEDANIHKNLLSSKLVDGPLKSSSRQNSSSQEHNHRENGYISFSGNKADEAAIVYEHGPLMPKLRHSDYYTEPNIQELAAKERAEPSYCCRVKDFVVGRKGYGFIKFFGETDVRQLDLQSIIEFKKGEVDVYESKTPPPLGQGLNKPAEITLLNIKCLDKKTCQHCTEGVEVDEFEKRLKNKTKQQGAEFMSYNVLKGEWKFRVKHFSKILAPREGLNKQAEMTLLNDKHVDQHCTKGEEFEKRLKRKTEDLGAEFMSSNAIEGEVKSCVKRGRKDGLDESGFWKTWRNLRERSMEYLKSKIWIDVAW